MGKERRDKFLTEERQGVWLGHHRQSNEHIIGTESGVVRAYSIRRLLEDRRWDGELIKRMRGTPQQPDPSRPGDSVPIRVQFDPSDAAAGPCATGVARQQEVGRRLRITPDMLRKYGYTDGCDDGVQEP